QSGEMLEQMLDGLKNYTGRREQTVLVVEPQQERCGRILAAIDAGDFQVDVVPEPAAAAQALRQGRGDCVILGPSVRAAAAQPLADLTFPADICRPSVILFEDDREGEDGEAWRALERACVVRRVRSLERLLDQATFTLHHDVT